MTTDFSLLDVIKFWNKVDIRTYQECWLWLGSKNRKGYGQFWLTNGVRAERAHRLAYLFTIGEIPDKMQVCHSCDNTACCNPAHLWLGTNAENMKDRNNKHRQAHGSRQGSAKLTEDIVDHIRKNYTGRRGEQTKLAEKYGVGRGAIWHVLHNRNWSSQEK